MSGTVFERIERRLAELDVPFTVLRHEPVFTSADAARVRGTPLASGAKALVCKAEGAFVMLVLPADRSLSSKRLRANRGWKSLRFATREEVHEWTGLAPGSIPPFGSLFKLATLCDPALAEQETINFNAGDHAISISMRWNDYLRVEQPELVGLSDC
ncbi:MAG TPA: YbaK/EbsC family protein [Pirellulales bacterium]|nr:YbaK/EbsC family protein [Pirellulales bacterium]